MKTGEKKRTFWLHDEVILLTTIIFLFTWSFAHGAQPQVASGAGHTVGLKADGTVVAVG